MEKCKNYVSFLKNLNCASCGLNPKADLQFYIPPLLYTTPPPICLLPLYSLPHIALCLWPLLPISVPLAGLFVRPYRQHHTRRTPEPCATRHGERRPARAIHHRQSCCCGGILSAGTRFLPSSARWTHPPASRQNPSTSSPTTRHPPPPAGAVSAAHALLPGAYLSRPSQQQPGLALYRTLVSLRYPPPLV